MQENFKCGGVKVDYKIKDTYKVSEIQEFSVDWNGWRFLVIYGRHKNGWFIAISNRNVCIEAGEPDDVFYNTEKLSKAIDSPEVPSMLAKAIKEHWEKIKR